jgi:hypothetical protein
VTGWYNVGEVVKVKRVFKLIKSEIFAALSAFLVMSLLSFLGLAVCGNDINKSSYLSMLKVLLLWFGFPVLIQPILIFIFPQYDSDSSFYASVGIYYLGAILSYLFKSLIAGFLVSLGLGCYIIYNVYIKDSRPVK